MISLSSDDIIKVLKEAGAPHNTALNVLEYMKENRHIWKAYQDYCLKIVAQGARRIGSKAVIELLRYNESGGDWTKYEDYKINNNYASYFARLFVAKFPEHKGLFLFRTITGLSNEE